MTTDFIKLMLQTAHKREQSGNRMSLPGKVCNQFCIYKTFQILQTGQTNTLPMHPQQEIQAYKAETETK